MVANGHGHFQSWSHCLFNYGEVGLLGNKAYLGICLALQEMRQGGLRIYLAKSKREVFARRILEHLELSVPSGKLDRKPELLAHILSENNIPASDSLTV